MVDQEKQIPHADEMRKKFALSPFIGALGARLGLLGDGTAEVELDLKGEFANRHGSIHGGVLATLADSSLSQSIRTKLGPDARTSTVEFKINYVAPAHGQRLTARGRAIRVGGSLATAQTEIYDSAGDIVAVGLGTFRIFRPQPKQKD